MLEVEWPSKIFVTCRHNFIRKRPASSFYGLGGIRTHFTGETTFVFVLCLKQIILSTTKFGMHKKIWA